ncbi:hypothetical protein SAMN04488515_0684 [Cognatiyoonia koreensis]|uniref:NADH dehydrogenase subunit E n=1 Tax=Cognatiyoonia koreensis TaxID=364200 RepID=A0A1I0NL93_9RHOB|nr:DUF5333 domain-containing protein [Cognatiyoonia koreensis]SEW02054.1 hypothetical protein SAMN04488515_0684 [Cognatiyoonia koreensis]
MRNTHILALAFAAATVGLAGNLSAQSALKDVSRVTEGLIAVGMAVELSDKCGDLSPRTLRGITFLRSLQNHARDLGFSQSQIDDFVDNKDEKRRLEAIARARLADLGVVEGQETTYCTVGRTQISQGTQVGRLLR